MFTPLKVGLIMLILAELLVWIGDETDESRISVKK